MRFANQVVILSGATSSNGEEIALQFAIEGATLVLVGRNEEKLNSVKRTCDVKIDDNGQPAFVIVADLTDDDEVKRVVDETVERYEKINILVNNTEIVREGSLIDRSILDTFDDVMNLNLRAVVTLTNFAAPHLIRTQGNIINISSIGAERVVSHNYISYFISKAGLNHFTRACAMDLGKRGVRVNTVSVGTSTSENFEYATTIDTKVDEENIADLVLHVASDKSKAVTGSNFVCDNGNLTSYFSFW